MSVAVKAKKTSSKTKSPKSKSAVRKSAKRPVSRRASATKSRTSSRRVAKSAKRPKPRVTTKPKTKAKKTTKKAVKKTAAKKTARKSHAKVTTKKKTAKTKAKVKSKTKIRVKIKAKPKAKTSARKAATKAKAPAKKLAKAAPKKSGVAKSNGVAHPQVEGTVFAAGEFVVYPPHGVGRILELGKEMIGDAPLELLLIEFERDKLLLRVPLRKVEDVGLRKLSAKPVVAKAMETLKRRAQLKRTMWSRRSQEYNSKINSGDLVSIAEVARDLFRPHRQNEQSYSERQLYEAARDRIAQELAVIQNIQESSALTKIENTLQQAYAPAA